MCREFGNVPKRSSGTAGAENSNNLGLSWGIGHGWGIHYQDLLKSPKIISHNIEAALHKSSFTDEMMSSMGSLETCVLKLCLI